MKNSQIRFGTNNDLPFIRGGRGKKKKKKEIRGRKEGVRSTCEVPLGGHQRLEKPRRRNERKSRGDVFKYLSKGGERGVGLPNQDSTS